MAFNYRPKSAKEIISKKKKNSVQVAAIYTFVTKNYNECIVLDPSTDFREVKIPRSVEKRENIVNLKKKILAATNATSIKISFGNGSGPGGGSSINAAETAKQENATRLFCESYVSSNKIPSHEQIVKVYPKYDDDWYETFCKQAKAIKKYLKGTGFAFSRDAPNGMMNYIEKIATTQCGVSTKDNWNPADIYATRKSKDSEIRKKIKDIANMKLQPPAKLDALNEYMRECFVKHDLVGISLKKINRNSAVRLEETNVTKQNTISDIAFTGNIKLDLDLNSNGEFKTGEMKFQLLVKGSKVDVQIRAFSGGERETTQMDMTEAGAAAKLGKVSSRYAIDPFINQRGLKRRMGTEIPRVGKWTKNDIEKYVKEFNNIRSMKIGGKSINFGSNDWESTLRSAIEIELDNPRTASQLCAKLQCFHWVKIFAKFRGKELDDFISTLYYGAKKQYSSAGPFLKMS
tara:strand:+ start:6590 stop:7969 length:1380 start_codon:yes stop_codon:yes gene_type:complete